MDGVVVVPRIWTDCLRMVRGTEGPGFIRSRERKFMSMDHGQFVPENESFTMGTNSLENKCFVIRSNC